MVSTLAQNARDVAPIPALGIFPIFIAPTTISSTSVKGVLKLKVCPMLGRFGEVLLGLLIHNQTPKYTLTHTQTHTYSYTQPYLNTDTHKLPLKVKRMLTQH